MREDMGDVTAYPLSISGCLSFFLLSHFFGRGCSKIKKIQKILLKNREKCIFLISLSLPSPKKRERRKKAKHKNQFSAPSSSRERMLPTLSQKKGEEKKSKT
jgi:hypothetical protein